MNDYKMRMIADDGQGCQLWQIGEGFAIAKYDPDTWCVTAVSDDCSGWNPEEVVYKKASAAQIAVLRKKLVPSPRTSAQALRAIPSVARQEASRSNGARGGAKPGVRRAVRIMKITDPHTGKVTQEYRLYRDGGVYVWKSGPIGDPLAAIDPAVTIDEAVRRFECEFKGGLR